jgi:hypothetical protein
MQKEKFGSRFNATEFSKSKKIMAAIFVIISISLSCTAAYTFCYIKDYEKKVDVNSSEAKFTISSSDLYLEYVADEPTSDSMYLDQVLQIEGEIIEAGDDFVEGAYIVLNGDNDGFYGIKCYFQESMKNQASLLKEGVNVFIKGHCRGSITGGFILVEECAL